MSHDALLQRIRHAFAAESAVPPEITLRGGDALDDYKTPPAFDSKLDAISDDYFEEFHWGVSHLDAASWKHYLPDLMAYALRHASRSSQVVDSLLSSLRPPDREPPRLGSLEPEQEAVIIELLDALAFGPDSAHQDFACQVLEEWWAPGALYRAMPT